jgi:hypothetical protein
MRENGLPFITVFKATSTGCSKSLYAPDDCNTKKTCKNTVFYDDLKMVITEYIHRSFTVIENTVRRVNKCLETGGGTF